MRSHIPDEPFVERGPGAAVETVLVPRTSDLGGFEVRRALPTRRRRTVGPFVFLDLMGPATFEAGRGLDVRPHPHIGLATVTWLLDGELLHRDSLGTVQPIRPGAVNWMTAGRGIVHSERTPEAARAGGGRLLGVQLWAALPARDEERAPAFAHVQAESLPLVEDGGASVRLGAGALLGARSPVATASDTIFADLALAPAARFEVPADHEERALLVVDGQVAEGDATFLPGQLLVLRPRARAVLTAAGGPARVVLLGGAALDGPRHVWWNFVSSSPERIEAAAADWAEGRFPPVPGETESIPLPARPRHP
jgi:redox-sensitive bicupin YhaK (pirin superfamily)